MHAPARQFRDDPQSKRVRDGGERGKQLVACQRFTPFPSPVSHNLHVEFKTVNVDLTMRLASAQYAIYRGSTITVVRAEDAVVSGFEMRVGDADREAAAAELREHFASGRLNQDELNERLDQAFAAKTRGDLHALMIDLPSSAAGWAAGAAASSATSGGPGFGRPGFGGSGFGASGARWIGPGAGGRQGSADDGAGYGWQRRGRQTAGTLVASFVMLWALLAVGLLAIFGIGGGRPFGIVLIFAAFALLRRLIVGIFRRRRGGSRGPRRRR
jgi:hypothetical protein